MKLTNNNNINIILSVIFYYFNVFLEQYVLITKEQFYINYLVLRLNPLTQKY
jgi:hypothetical protein